jgi:hypothetical protein
MANDHHMVYVILQTWRAIRGVALMSLTSGQCDHVMATPAAIPLPLMAGEIIPNLQPMICYKVVDRSGVRVIEGNGIRVEGVS